MSNKNDNISQEGTERKLPLSETLVLGIQHMFIAIISGIPVPLIVGNAVGLSAKDMAFFITAILFTTGVCTLLASLNIIPFMAPRIPLVMGISFGVITVLISAFNTGVAMGGGHDLGFQLIAGATIITGVFCFLVAPLWSKLERLFPLVVIGTNLMVLSIALLPNAFNWIMTGSSIQEGAVDPKFLFLALFVFVLNVVLSKYLKGFIGNLTILISLVAGTILAGFMGVLDLSGVGEAAWFGVTLPFAKGLPKFDLNLTISFLVVMILGMVEVSGTVMGIHGIVGKKMNEDQLTRTLRTTGLNTVISGAFNSAQPVSFIQNVGLLELTKEPSRFPAAMAGGLLLVLSFFPKFGALVSAIPKPVLGGIGFATFGIIVASGVNVLKNVSFEGNNNMLLIGLSVGMAMLPTSFPGFYANFPQIIQDIFGNGLLAGSITAVVLNMFFNFKETFMPNAAKDKEKS